MDTPRVARTGARDWIEIALTGSGKSHVIMFDGRFLAAFDIIGIHPAPRQSTAVPDGLTVTVDTSDTGTRVVKIAVTPLSAGWKRYGLTINERTATASSVILP